MLRPVLFMPNDYIVRQGDVGDEMYFIHRGKVTKNSQHSFPETQLFGKISNRVYLPFLLTFAFFPFRYDSCEDLGLKAVDTIGNCQRPVFSLSASQHMHKITNL